ncbi:hypothetical protein KIN20_032034 [Parelaphostrongylus tenuis]|uniref:G-protein coupled receptors family 1 profile domain-containing protein n=1 Tax=Parelaphostrongylus tenuis TaxID=148309 RepID=A0AAD5R6F9_PARTN|nr:hypothetical protein KIN20_032034 [Parelaphostrongylus tenuis]
MTKLSFLIVDIIINTLQLSVIVCNGFILILFARQKSLRQSSCGKLVLFLTTTDFLHAVTTLPYTIYLTSNWNPTYINLSPYYILISSTPLVIQLKINLTITIAIAVERTLALSFPVTFRKLSSRPYAAWCLFLGILLAMLDLIVEFSLSPFKSVPNCAAIGCFISDSFRNYWGISNMLMGIVVIVLISSMLVKLRGLHQNSQPHDSVKVKGNRFKQANRSSAGILLISLMFVTLPSVGAGVVEIIGFSLFTTFGPFYIVGLLSSGVCNSVVYLILNKEVQAVAKNFVTGRKVSTTMAVSTFKAFSTGPRTITREPHHVQQKPSTLAKIT